MRWGRTLLVLSGAFFLATVFFTTQNFFYYQLRPDERPLSLRQEFLLYIVRWLPWVVCAPAVLWLWRKSPPTNGLSRAKDRYAHSIDNWTIYIWTIGL